MCDVQMIFPPPMDQNLNHTIILILHADDAGDLNFTRAYKIQSAFIHSQVNGILSKLLPFHWNLCLATTQLEIREQQPSYLLAPISSLKPESMCCAFNAGGLAGNSGLNSALPGQRVRLCRLRQTESPSRESIAFHREKTSECLRGMSPLPTDLPAQRPQAFFPERTKTS